MGDPPNELLPRAVASQPTEILFNYLSIVGGKFLTDLLQGFLALRGGQITPALFTTNVAGRCITGSSRSAGIRIIRWVTTGLTSPAATRSRTRRIFQLFDHAIELGDNVVLFSENASTRTTKIEPPLNVVHQARNFIERVGF